MSFYKLMKPENLFVRRNVAPTAITSLEVWQNNRLTNLPNFDKIKPQFANTERFCMSFFNQVYELVKLIPKGKVTTYGIIAAALGRPHSAKIVGYALHDNKDPQNVPCYRVVNRYGEVSSAFAFGGENAQRAMLEHDGVTFIDGKVDLTKHLYKFGNIERLP